MSLSSLSSVPLTSPRLRPLILTTSPPAQSPSKPTEMFTRSRVVLAAALATAAQTSNTLTVTQPSSDHRCTIQRVWQLENAHEAQGLPTQFTVMLNNPNTALLVSGKPDSAASSFYERGFNLPRTEVADGASKG